MANTVRSNAELNDLANGKNLVVNGDFSQGTYGWEEQLTAVISVVSGRLRVAGADTANYGSASQVITGLTIGATYEVNIDSFAGTSLSRLIIDNVIMDDATNYTFIATTTSTVIFLQQASLAVGEYAEFDNISVKEVPKVQGENLPDYVATRSNYGFKNYIINGGFDVWQRGESFTLTTDGSGYFAPDRFQFRAWNTNDQMLKNIYPRNNNKYYTSLRTKLLNEPTAIDRQLNQMIENARQFDGKTLTFSFDYFGTADVNLVFRPRIYIHSPISGDSYPIDISSDITVDSTTPSRASCTFDVDFGTRDIDEDAALWCQMIGISADVNAEFYTAYWQLEEGSVATPFEQRPYGLELSLCQRYYETGFINWNGYVENGNNYSEAHQYKAEKRVSPTVTLTHSSSVSMSSSPLLANNRVDGLSVYYGAVGTGGANFNVSFTSDAEL